MAVGVSCTEASTPEGMRLYAVGDIHGRHDLLAAMHARLMEEILHDRPADWRIIYLGDYVDRGSNSRGVLEYLANLRESDPRVIALAGNHDVGFLDFLSNPDPFGLFSCHGGFETALSYGVEIDLTSREAMEPGHAALVRAVPQRHRALLATLPYSVSFGDFFFCHAGIRPGVPLEDQTPDDLTWIRRAFHAHEGLHPKLIVHGHTPVRAPEICSNRINLDTGAWHTGRLTALKMEGREKVLIEAAC
ncbi:serine/threonine protein phosphatase [Nitratireductor aquibiodomus]|uniref:metallophosphoesterase family protein n=1 Tax=Nitratireductor aquibiodomus TaxID=204799 RepID=UPI0019D3A467|nr:metallophosphoesterase family protein [Nitratireductor aquibiodomus]MBN7763326.1 serine/threonine protein phosphatase [Nitratireductor aquibiodomus]